MTDIDLFPDSLKLAIETAEGTFYQKLAPLLEENINMTNRLIAAYVKEIKELVRKYFIQTDDVELLDLKLTQLIENLINDSIALSIQQGIALQAFQNIKNENVQHVKEHNAGYADLDKNVPNYPMCELRSASPTLFDLRVK